MAEREAPFAATRRGGRMKRVGREGEIPNYAMYPDGSEYCAFWAEDRAAWIRTFHGPQFGRALSDWSPWEVMWFHGIEFHADDSDDNRFVRERAMRRNGA